MAVSATFLNDLNQKPEIYIGRPDLGRYTLTLGSPVALNAVDVRLQFPGTLFSASDVAKIKVLTAGWTATVQGNMLVLGGSQPISAGGSLVIQFGSVASSLTSQTNADLGVRVNGQNISPPFKIFLLRYPEFAGDLQKSMSAQLLPDSVYVTPLGNVTIENLLVLQLTNLKPGEALVTKPWVDTPTVLLSFVYGDSIGALTPSDPKDPFSAWNIRASVEATYNNGHQTYEWDATNPDSGAGANDPVWTLKPVSTNLGVLGPASGATAAFVIEHISTQAPRGATLAYLQYSNFPGYDDGYFSLKLQKHEPTPNIIFFNGVPSNLANLGDEATLRWQCFDVQQVKLQFGNTTLDSAKGQIGTGVASIDQYKIKLDTSTQFTLNAYKTLNAATPDFTTQFTVNVPPVGIGSFAASAYSGTLPAKIDLTWQIQAASSAVITAPGQSDYVIPRADLLAGTCPVFPQKPITYTLTVQGQGGPLVRTLDLFFLSRGWSTFHTGTDFKALSGAILLGDATTLWLFSPDTAKAIFNTRNGQTWTQVAGFDESFPARSNAGGVYWKGKFWLMGGDTGAQRLNDIWSSTDGKQWTQVLANAAWPGRSSFGCLVFKDQLWVLGGLDQNYQALNDVWCSSDGSNWQKVGTAGWAPRSRFGVTASSTTLYVVGGVTSNGSLGRDLWTSSQGSTWQEQPPLPASTRSDPILFSRGTDVFVLGGIGPDGAPLEDLNSYADNNWSVLPGVAWSVSSAGSTWFRDGLWIAGGTTATGTSQAGPNKTVYVLMF